MKNKILIFLISINCTINQLQAPFSSFVYREPVVSHAKPVENSAIVENKSSHKYIDTNKNQVDQQHSIAQESTKVSFSEKLKNNLNLSKLLSENQLSKEKKSKVDNDLDLLQARVLYEYKNKNIDFLNSGNQAQANVYVNNSFKDVYKECKSLVDKDRSLTSFDKFVKAFNRSVSITIQLYSFKSQKFVAKAVDAIKSVADRFNSLSEKDQQNIYYDIYQDTKPDSESFIIFDLEQRLNLKEKELLELQKKFNKVELEASLNFKNKLLEIDSLTGIAREQQKSLQDQISRLTLENQEIREKLSSQDLSIGLKPQVSLIVPSVEKLPVSLLESVQSKDLKQADALQPELQKELQKLKAENLALSEQLNYLRQSSVQREFNLQVKEKLVDKVAMKVENGIGVQEIKNNSGEVVGKKLFIIDESGSEPIPFQEFSLKSSSVQNDGSIQVIDEVYNLDDSGRRLEGTRHEEIEVFIVDEQGDKRVKNKIVKDFAGNIIHKTEYIPDSTFDIGVLYDISLIGLRKNDPFDIISYQKKMSKGSEELLIRLKVKESFYEIKDVQSTKNNKNRLTVINKIEIQQFDVQGKKFGSPKLITETKELSQNNFLESKMVKIEGQSQATKYVYDTSGKVKEEVVYNVKGNTLTEVSRIQKEYWQDQNGSEMVTDKNKFGGIIKITKDGQDVAGLHGIFFDHIFSEEQLLDKLKQALVDVKSKFDIDSKVDNVIENYKKEIRDNIAKELRLDIKEVKKSVSSFDDAQAQEYIENFLNDVYKSYERKINLFIIGIKDIFIKDFKNNLVALESNNSQVKPVNKVSSINKKASEKKAIQVAQKSMESQIRQAKEKQITEQVQNYSEKENNELLYLYLKKHGVFDLSGVSDHLKSESLKNAQNEKITELVDQAMQSPQVKQLIKSAGSKLVLPSLSDVQQGSSSSSARVSSPSLLDSIRLKNNKEPVESQSSPAKNSNMFAELQAKLQSRSFID